MFASIVILLVSLCFANCRSEKTICKIDNDCYIKCKSDKSINIEILKSCNTTVMELETIDVDVLRKLKSYPMEKVILANNNIQNIDDLFQGTNIQNLYLSKNNIAELKTGTFDGMKPLKNLALNRNKIKVLHSKSIPIVEMLYLQYNLIESLNADVFNNISQVKCLRLNNNHIKKMTAESLMGLKANRLKLSFNYIEYLEERSIPEVKNLFMNNNKLVTIDSSMFVNISYMNTFDVSYNSISNIPNFIFENSNLSILNISNNKITYISQNTFSGMKMLKDLVLSNNQIKYLEIKSLPPVNNLNLSHNLITSINASIFIDIDSSINLDISYNCIQSTDFNLKGLNVSNQKDNETCMLTGHHSIELFTSKAKIAVFLMLTLLLVVVIGANAIRIYSKRFSKTSVHLKNKESPNLELFNGNNNRENIYEEINEQTESVEHFKENDLYGVMK